MYLDAFFSPYENMVLTSQVIFFLDGVSSTCSQLAPAVLRAKH